MRTRKEMILEAMDSMLASAQLEAMPGITLEKFLKEFELYQYYPKKGDTGRFTPAQIKYIKSVLDSAYRTRNINGEQYYQGQGILI